MELKKPMESIGWLGGSGYEIVIDEKARREAEALAKGTTQEKQQELVTPKSEVVGAA